MKLSELIKQSQFSNYITVIDKNNGNIAVINTSNTHDYFKGYFIYLNPEHKFLGEKILHNFGDMNSHWEFYKPCKTILPLP